MVPYVFDVGGVDVDILSEFEVCMSGLIYTNEMR